MIPHWGNFNSLHRLKKIVTCCVSKFFYTIRFSCEKCTSRISHQMWDVNLVKSRVAGVYSNKILSRDIYGNYIFFPVFTFVYCQDGLLRLSSLITCPEIFSFLLHPCILQYLRVFFFLPNLPVSINGFSEWNHSY